MLVMTGGDAGGRDAKLGGGRSLKEHGIVRTTVTAAESARVRPASWIAGFVSWYVHANLDGPPHGNPYGTVPLMLQFQSASDFIVVLLALATHGGFRCLAIADRAAP